MLSAYEFARHHIPIEIAKQLFKYQHISSIELEEQSLYLCIHFGNGHFQDYTQFLPTSFVKKSRNIIEIMNQFGGVSAYLCIEEQYVSEHPKSTT